jgi:hypothetical protein
MGGKEETSFTSFASGFTPIQPLRHQANCHGPFMPLPHGNPPNPRKSITDPAMFKHGNYLGEITGNFLRGMVHQEVR